MRKRRRRRISGLILRLIDVVLILLFGFIAISEVSRRSKIDLAESLSVPATAPDREIVVYVGVLPDGTYLVDEERSRIRGVDHLTTYISNQRDRLDDQNLRMRVRVRSNHDAAVEHAFALVNICQDMRIPVGLDVIRKNR
jgi:biopolymer transport protein ExbD